jgi:GTP-binding protein EngB required for normal cell division
MAEIAFARPNVGKSSLLNLLLGRRGMARVSGTPGTQTVNFFVINRTYFSSISRVRLRAFPGAFSRAGGPDRSVPHRTPRTVPSR